MKQELHEIFKALNEAGVRYIVAGDLAVIAHGLKETTSVAEKLPKYGSDAE
jgi:hypothetical protein